MVREHSDQLPFPLKWRQLHISKQYMYVSICVCVYVCVCVYIYIYTYQLKAVQECVIIHTFWVITLVIFWFPEHHILQ